MNEEMNEEIVDCHYCEHAGCITPDGWCDCYVEYGYFSHEVKDSKKEAEECDWFMFCDIFPKS